MRILVVTQYYWPEPFNVGDMCEELVRRGHQVTVLTGFPNYPEGEWYAGYSGKRPMEETRNSVNIMRVPHHPRKQGAIHRMLNYETFSRNASKAARKLGDEFDVAFAYEVSPVMSASPALAYAKTHDVPAVIYVLDIWPQCLLSGGIDERSGVYRYYEKVSRRIYSGADMLLLSSPSFQSYLDCLLGIPGHCCHLPQYAEDIFADGVSGAEGATIPAGYDDDIHGVDVTFAGNVGAAQSVETLIRAFAPLGPDIRLHVVGAGSELQHCRQLADGLSAENVFFHGRHELSEMPLYYGLSDALAISFMDDPVIGYTLPRKMQTYLAAAKPVLGSVTGEAARVIEEARCGLYCKPEAPEAFAELCRTFAASSQDQRREWSENARVYYDGHYSRDLFFDRLEELLNQMVETYKKERRDGCL